MVTKKIGDTRWALTSHTMEDTACPAGDHTYRLVVSDPTGNTTTAQIPSVTVSQNAKDADKEAERADDSADDEDG